MFSSRLNTADLPVSKQGRYPIPQFWSSWTSLWSMPSPVILLCTQGPSSTFPDLWGLCCARTPPGGFSWETFKEDITSELELANESCDSQDSIKSVCCTENMNTAPGCHTPYLKKRRNITPTHHLERQLVCWHRSEPIRNHSYPILWFIQ